MDDELEEEGGRAEDLAGGEMSEAGSQSGGQLEDGEELLEQDESGEGRKRLVGELKFRQGVSLTANGGSAKLHVADLRVVMSLLETHTHTTEVGPPFLGHSAPPRSDHVRSLRAGQVDSLPADFTDGEVWKPAPELRNTQAGQPDSLLDQCELCN
jgi:hypothetical protein